MAGLPPVVQVFEVSAAAFLEGIDRMLAQVDKLAGSLDAAAASAERMGGVFDATAASDERFAAAEEAAEARAVYLADAMDRVVAALDESAAASDRAMAATDELAASYDRAGTSATVAGDEAEASGKKAAVFGGAWKTALLGVGIAAVYGIDQAAKFQSNMEQLHTQAGLAQSKLAGLSQQVLQLAGQVGEGPESLSESLYHVASNMASTGATGAQMLDAVKVAAEGAQVGGADLVDVTNALGAAIASGIPGVQNYTQAMGYMNATVGAGDMHMQDLADAFGTGVLANIKQYGVTLQDVSAALATFGDNNIRGAKAGTDLRMAVQSLAKQGPSAAATLSQLGLGANSLSDAMKDGGLNSARDIEQEIGPRPEGTYDSGHALYSLDRIDNNGNYRRRQWRGAGCRAPRGRPAARRAGRHAMPRRRSPRPGAHRGASGGLRAAGGEGRGSCRGSFRESGGGSAQPRAGPQGGVTGLGLACGPRRQEHARRHLQAGERSAERGDGLGSRGDLRCGRGLADKIGHGADALDRARHQRHRVGRRGSEGHHPRVPGRERDHGPGSAALDGPGGYGSQRISNRSARLGALGPPSRFGRERRPAWSGGQDIAISASFQRSSSAQRSASAGAGRVAGAGAGLSEAMTTVVAARW